SLSSHLIIACSSPLSPSTTLFRSRGTSATDECGSRPYGADTGSRCAADDARHHPKNRTRGPCCSVRLPPCIPVGITHRFSWWSRSEEHTSELQSRFDLVCRLLLEK